MSIKAPSNAAGRAGLDGMGMGSGQKIHDGGSEEMVKDMGVGGGGARWMACLGEVREGKGRGELCETRNKRRAKISRRHTGCWPCSHLHTESEFIF